MKVLHDGQALIVGLEDVNLSDFPDLKVIGCNCTGTEHLPWDEIRHRGIKVISLKDYPEFLKDITSTAEHTIGLIIALMRNYKAALNGPYKDRETYKGQRLNGKALGIIGHGRIGSQVEAIARSLKMVIYAIDGSNCKNLCAGGAIRGLLMASDVVSIHIPLKGNEGFFTKEMFQQMKKSAYFINTSRSGVVDKGALLWALENDIISGAAVDFIDDPDLVRYAEIHNNLILTPHLGGNTIEDREKTESFIIKQVENYLHNV